jgi:hypothetical protein
MNAATKYRRRALEVEAVQWTAHNLDEIRALCSGAFTIDCGWALAIPIPEDRRVVGMRDFLVAHVGHYVVRIADGLYLPMTAEHFEKTYEQVPSEPQAEGVR